MHFGVHCVRCADDDDYIIVLTQDQYFDVFKVTSTSGDGLKDTLLHHSHLDGEIHKSYLFTSSNNVLLVIITSSNVFAHFFENERNQELQDIKRIPYRLKTTCSPVVCAYLPSNCLLLLSSNEEYLCYNCRDSKNGGFVSLRFVLDSGKEYGVICCDQYCVEYMFSVSDSFAEIALVLRSTLFIYS